MPEWKTETELAEMLMRLGKEGRVARLLPDTARRVGRRLMQSQSKPSRNEIAKVICGVKCGQPCYGCLAKANAVVDLYGERGPGVDE